MKPYKILLISILILSIKCNAQNNTLNSILTDKDTITVSNHYCESMNPNEIDTTKFYYRNDSLIIRNVKDEFCCPNVLKAAIYIQNDSININVFNPSGLDCLCDCSYGYTVKIFKPDGDNFKITINGESFVVMKSDLTTSIHKINNGLKIYPNPINDFLYIDNNHSIDLEEIILFDNYGKLIYKTNLKLDKIDLSNFAKGFYILSIKTSNEIMVQKLIKE